MHCREFEQRLNAALDERVSPEADSRLTAHAANCDRCRQLLAAHDALFVGLSCSTAPPLSRDFSRRVMTQVAPPPWARSSKRTWLSLAACLVSAAVMLLTISVVWYARRTRLPDGAAGVAKQLIGAQRDRAAGFAIANHQPRRTLSGTALTGSELLLEAPRLPVYLRGYGDTIDDLALSLPDMVERLDEVERLAPGMQHLRRSLSMIWDTLCRTIPGASTPPAPRDGTSYSPLDHLQIA